MITIIDNFGLNDVEKALIEENAEEMTFDFIRYADELKVTINPHNPTKGETLPFEFDVLIEGTSEEDSRGNGYFIYGYTRELLNK